MLSSRSRAVTLVLRRPLLPAGLDSDRCAQEKLCSVGREVVTPLGSCDG